MPLLLQMRMKMSLRYIFRGGRNRNWNWNYSYRMMSTTTTTTIMEPWKLSISPWLMLPSDRSSTKLYSLAEKKVVSFKKETPPPAWAQGRVIHMGCTQGWMASFNEDNQQTFLSNPITGRHIKLPNIRTLPTTPSNCFWASPSNIILTSSPDAHDCRAIMIRCYRIAVCFPGHNSSTWLPLCDHTNYYPKALVYSTRLFCVTSDGVVECWDLESPSFVWKVPISLLSPPSKDDDEDEDEDEDGKVSVLSSYLLMDEHSDRLFLVYRNVLKHVGRDGSYVKPLCYHGNPHKTLSFDVYEIDGKKGTIRKMEGSLYGLAMFVGGNHSFALPAADFNLTPDSIYFVNDINKDQGRDIGIFNCVDRKISSVYYPSHSSQISRGIAPAFWFTPNPH